MTWVRDMLVSSLSDRYSGMARIAFHFSWFSTNQYNDVSSTALLSAGHPFLYSNGYDAQPRTVRPLCNEPVAD
jgi:hypothetical protein